LRLCETIARLDHPVSKTVRPKVHSLAVDPEAHGVYTPEEAEDGKPMARIVVFEAVNLHGQNGPK